MEKVHELKITPEHFAPVAAGLKRAELRLNDRNYQVGDLLSLHEWDDAAHEFTGQFESVRVIHIADVGQWLSGYVMLSFER